MRYQLRYIRVLARPGGPIGLRDRTLAYGWVGNANRLENAGIRGLCRRVADVVPTSIYIAGAGLPQDRGGGL
ncbi:hypothetical protein NSK11_contig00116-0034 [Nocardia seriolae]|uniref:Uncharacterized protein n=1 Tax=Nocardia seriolae TaxID=37332 RepID=A0ABC9Z1K2_9NOCA|nr:hypothetical protein NS07_v2contig00110-0004 [Nocardia seriolae]GAP31507.1 hypothetical protein NSK11_contig00116-0034 [Nocardia seriolae]